MEKELNEEEAIFLFNSDEIHIIGQLADEVSKELTIIEFTSL